jgi:hypothetical protein
MLGEKELVRGKKKGYLLKTSIESLTRSALIKGLSQIERKVAHEKVT